MNNDKSGNDRDDDKIISFPAAGQRKALKKNNKTQDKEKAKSRKKQDELEDQYRNQYREERAARARMQVKMAQQSASGKVPFFNFDRIPFFTRSIIAVFLIVQIAMSFLISAATKTYVLYNFAFIPAKYTGAGEFGITALFAPFTSLIIHGGWMHIVFNVVMMLAMGVFFEREFGAKRTVIFFVLCGLIGNLAYLLINPFSPAPVIGASGAISGLFAVTIMVMGARGMMGPEIQKRGPFPFILFWSAIIIAMGFIGSGTSWQSHLGGFWGGIGLYLWWKKRGFRT